MFKAVQQFLATIELANNLKVQLCKLCNNKYMITLIQITNTEIFALIAALIIKLWSRKVLLIKKNARDFFSLTRKKIFMKSLLFKNLCFTFL